MIVQRYVWASTAGWERERVERVRLARERAGMKGAAEEVQRVVSKRSIF